MARSDAARDRQGGQNGKSRRSASEVGQYGNTRPRDDAHVRRARRMETDGRLKAARAELAAHEAKLAALETELADTAHEAPYRLVAEALAEPRRLINPDDYPIMQRVHPQTGEPIGPPIDLRVKKPQLPRQASWQQEEEARELLAQGYHRDRVAARVAVDPEALRHLVADDGYAKTRGNQ